VPERLLVHPVSAGTYVVLDQLGRVTPGEGSSRSSPSRRGHPPARYLSRWDSVLIAYDDLERILPREYNHWSLGENVHLPRPWRTRSPPHRPWARHQQARRRQTDTGALAGLVLGMFPGSLDPYCWSSQRTRSRLIR
jgi:hypothetical protein